MPPSTCIPTSSAICLGPTNRFRVETEFRNQNVLLPAFADEVRQDSGLFFFFSPENVEVVLKILNACSSTPPRYWVFLAGLSNVEYTVTVTDTQAGRTKKYFNAAGVPPAATQDTSALATCP